MPNNLSPVAASLLKVLHERSPEETRVQHLARDLNRSAASVSVMLGKLEREGWVRHRPYQAVTLTEAGRNQAAELERRHNLLERHLIETLGYSLQVAHEESERMESALSDLLITRLEALLERAQPLLPLPPTSTQNRYIVRQGML